MKALVAFKDKLEKRLEVLNSETAEVTATLDAVNSVLLEKGFKRGDVKDVKETAQPFPKELTPTPPASPKQFEQPAVSQSEESENVIPLRTATDEPLAIIYVEGNELHVMPDESKKFSVKTPPFHQFLVERILARMQEKDSELVRMGQLTADKMFTYNIVMEGDLIREILFKNVDEERLRELKSSIRWTFEKMYEKNRGA
jgi:hypothetical protein